MKSLLSVKNLSISFPSSNGSIDPLLDVSLSLQKGETLGIVGESGCGKSLTSLAIMGLLPPQAKVVASEMMVNQTDIINAKEKEKRKLLRTTMAMIFQDPMSSLNPALSIKYQLLESIKIGHPHLSKKECLSLALELLEKVGIPDPKNRINCFAHELSGGMCQRIMIAMALAARPKLLIADEPTTALDVTIQAQILSLLKQIQKEYDMGLILISHDLSVVAQMSDRILVMYAGQVVEAAPANELIQSPKHPYTQGLLKSLPQDHGERAPLNVIKGSVPDLKMRPKGCQFAPRCNHARSECKNPVFYKQINPHHSFRCILQTQEENFHV